MERWFTVLVLAGVVGILAVTFSLWWLFSPDSVPSSNGSEQTVSTSSVDVEMGGSLYRRHCASCHGNSGRGKGPGAEFLSVKPMNFHSARARSYSRQQLINGIKYGVQENGMPPWNAHLSQDEIESIVRYIREEFQDE